MATPSTLIIRALQLIGEVAVGDLLVSAQEVAYLSVLNGMIESWALDDLMIYQNTQDSFTVTANQATYTIGPAAQVSTARPVDIRFAFVRDTSSMDTPLTILTQENYNRIVVKNVGTTYPEYIYYDNTFDSNGRSSLTLYPLPIAGLTVFIDSVKILQSFPLITTTLNLPPGYQRAIETNLACEIAPGFVPVPPDVIRIARESKQLIKSANVQIATLRMDGAIVRQARPGSSILTGP